MGLSDGARIDTLRRVNVGTISNEQIVIATQIDEDKWKSLMVDLRQDLKKIRPGEWGEEKFSRVYLIDDFTASGTTLLRCSGMERELKGKLLKFARSIEKAKADLGGISPFIEDYDIVVHHYIGTEKAKTHIENVYAANYEKFKEKGCANIKFRFGLLLPLSLQVTKESNDPFVKLCKQYYDPMIEGEGLHGGESGITDKMFGYANCGQTVVMEQNTPNNSLPLLWAETQGENGNHKMRPLFRRRERHSDLIKDTL